eukprot:TRINITY_DN11868_c0_g1_i1.p1 TRINITY_DN11868_c0_g1~~TRINITY_DN11868_c0_g1_i1.p1  ORF type:complete len:221 (-),score=12.96 TRINITY_DN11868_c0_g1_i1:274-936(-)
MYLRSLMELENSTKLHTLNTTSFRGHMDELILQNWYTSLTSLDICITLDVMAVLPRFRNLKSLNLRSAWCSYEAKFPQFHEPLTKLRCLGIDSVFFCVDFMNLTCVCLNLKTLKFSGCLRESLQLLNQNASTLESVTLNTVGGVHWKNISALKFPKIPNLTDLTLPVCVNNLIVSPELKTLRINLRHTSPEQFVKTLVDHKIDLESLKLTSRVTVMFSMN